MKRILLLAWVFMCTMPVWATGVMVVNANQGTYFRLINSSVNVDVNNQVAMITSSQLFVNTLDNAFVGKYAFPMPANATALQLRWKIQGGVWQYASFSANDQDSTLPGQPGAPAHPDLKAYLGETPLYFSILDTIAVNDTIEVELQYVQLLSYRFNIVTFEYPSDYSLIQYDQINLEQSLSFNLFSERTIESLYMVSDYADVSNNGHVATLEFSRWEGNSVDDYHVEYILASDELGIISFSTFLPDSLVTCDELGNGYLGLIIEPESNENTEVIEKVFTLVIDRSGSMGWEAKMEKAKQACNFIVENLNEGDYFNIISFSGDVTSFQPDHVPYTAYYESLALEYINNIQAVGGTNINDALLTAIGQFGFADPNKANIIIFFTDGEASAGVTNTNSILNNVQTAVNNAETNIFLYSFGLGTDANEQLLTLLAMQNQGLSVFVTNEDIQTVISEFYLTIRNPVLLNTEVTFIPDIISEYYPSPMPNLYKGMQLIITGRYDLPQDVRMVLSGKAFNLDVEYVYDISLADTVNPNFMFLPKLWAKQKIEYLTYLYYSLGQNSTQAQAVEETIEQISICYQVLSEFTSFVDNGTTYYEEILADKPEFAYSFSPNPFDTQTSLVINLKMPALISVSIYDSKGILIYSILENGIAGENILTWNGDDSRGKQVDSGIYFYTVRIGNESYFGKIVKL